MEISCEQTDIVQQSVRLENCNKHECLLQDFLTLLRKRAGRRFADGVTAVGLKFIKIG